jgi:hypothetical protein
MTPEEKAYKIFGVKITDDYKQNSIALMKIFPVGSAKEDVLKKLNNIAASRDDCKVIVNSHQKGTTAVLFNIVSLTTASEQIFQKHSTMFIFSKENKLTEISPVSGTIPKIDFDPAYRSAELTPEEKASKIFGVEITDIYEQNSIKMMKVFPVGSAKGDVLKKLNDIVKSRDDCRIFITNRPDGTDDITFDIASTAVYGDNYKIKSILFEFSNEKKLTEISTATVIMPKSEYAPTNKEQPKEKESRTESGRNGAKLKGAGRKANRWGQAEYCNIFRQ